MDTTTQPSASTQPSEGLHKELSLVDASAFSVGLIGPVGAIGLLGTGAALIIGRAVTLSFEHERAAVHRLAGFGDQVEILDPPSVRAELLATAREILGRYQSGG